MGASLSTAAGEWWGGQYERLATLEFERDRKSMSVLCRPRDKSKNQNQSGGNRLFVKVLVLQGGASGAYLPV